VTRQALRFTHSDLSNFESATFTTRDFWWHYCEAAKRVAAFGPHPGYGVRVENEAMHADFAEYAVKCSIQAMFTLFW